MNVSAYILSTMRFLFPSSTRWIRTPADRQNNSFGIRTVLLSALFLTSKYSIRLGKFPESIVPEKRLSERHMVQMSKELLRLLNQLTGCWKEIFPPSSPGDQPVELYR